MMYIKRELQKKLVKFMAVPEILAVVGARQVGKTTLIENVLENITNKKIKKISFDNINILNEFVYNIDSFIKLYIEPNDILFIDELHYAKDSGRLLKYIYDTKKKKKIIISGSSAVELSIQSLKYLVGRVVSFELYSFSFLEFLSTKQKNLAEVYFSLNYKEPILRKLNKYLEEYLLYGGYPRVVLEEDIDIKKELLNNIYNTYILRDIKEIQDIKDDFKLHKLIQALSLQIGNLVDNSELRDITGYYHEQLKSIANILEKTYICKFVSPFYKNKRTELVKRKKVYFYDLGLRNAILNNYSFTNKELGAIKENFLISELLKRNLDVKYWRSQGGAEVDIIIDKGKEIIPIEIKNKLKNTNITRSQLAFINKYNPKKMYTLSDDFEGKRKVNKTLVVFLPFVKFLPLIPKL